MLQLKQGMVWNNGSIDSAAFEVRYLYDGQRKLSTTSANYSYRRVEGTDFSAGNSLGPCKYVTPTIAIFEGVGPCIIWVPTWSIFSKDDFIFRTTFFC